MSNLAISQATLTALQSTDVVPLIRANDTTARKALAQGAGFGPLQIASTTIAASALLTLSSVPVTLVPAQGANTVICVLGGLCQVIPGTSDIANTPNPGALSVGWASSQPSVGSFATPLGLATAYSMLQLAGGSEGAACQNAALVLKTAQDFGAIGPVQTYAINTSHRGSGYLVNDTGTVTIGDSGNRPAYKITSIGAGGGPVFGVTLTSLGSNCLVTTGAATVKGGAQPGSGAGLQLNVTSVGPVATAHAVVSIAYRVIALS